MHLPFSLGHWRPLIRRVPSPGTIALTFDDGPTPETTPKLLRLLSQAQVRATFFISGIRAEAHPALVRAIVEAGHAVYGHGWEHVHLDQDPKRAIADMRRVETLLARHRPTPTTYLVRLPYNDGYAQVSMHRAMAEFHPDVQFAWWSHSTEDYLIAGRCRTAADLRLECRAVAAKLERSNLEGAIILMHEYPYETTSPFVPQVTEVLVPMVLDVVVNKGLRPVALKGIPLRPGVRRWILTPIRSADRSTAFPADKQAETP